jgi:uncharacterized protein
MAIEWVMGLVGGVLIGFSVSLMLLWNGRVTGISGIVNGVLNPIKGDTSWKWYFLGGLLLGGALIKFVLPTAFSGQLETEIWTVVVAGLLVGFGPILGSGCTSGHGICGISRLSPRSIVATLVFISAGIVIVAFLRRIGVFL